ncbi:MAG: tryptophan synthase subunit alpha [Blastocatellia bacterium]|nr:tryptophan synthase subunit alpha [Blastocatellia bacterium]
MNRYTHRFQHLRENGQKAFIPFTLLGWPNRETCLETIQVMIANGATALELGLAFSDPVADGPVVQEAALETLNSGFRVRDAFELIREIREFDAEIPIGLLVYFNMVMAKGGEAFFREAAAVGVDGVLIADLPPDAENQTFAQARAAGIAPICIISPLTSDERLRLIAQEADGFLYVVSRLGITGTDERYDTSLQDLLERAHRVSDLPLCIGFGISSPEHAQTMCKLGADGVITGSKIIQVIRENRGNEAVALSGFLRNMVAATGKVGS